MFRHIHRPTSWRVLGLRLFQLNVGLVLYGLSVALMLRANVGLGPWDVFHQGLALRTPLTVGQAMVLAGVVLVLYSSVAARQHPGLGTLFNMVMVGVWVDVFLAMPSFPDASGWVQGTTVFAVGIAFTGVATGLYITAGLGAGPRDSFALGLSRNMKISVGRARMAVEVTVCLLGWLLGGSVGVGTIVFALAIGPLMQVSLRLFGGLEGRYGRATSALVGRREARAARRPNA